MPLILSPMIHRARRASRMAGAPWTPASIAGLQVWLDASDAATLFQDSALTTPATADSDPVGGWQDQSGQGHHATQSTSGFRPLLALAAQNSLNGIRLDGSDDYLSIGDLSTSFPTAATGFLVYLLNSTTEYNVFDTAVNSDFWRYAGDGNGYIGTWRNSRLEGYPATMPTTGAHLATIISSASTYEVFRNGVSAGVQAADYWSGHDYTLGAAAAGGSKWLHGDLYEACFYSAVLGSTDREMVEAYLTTKWGL